MRKLFSLTHQVDADVLKLQSLFSLGDVVPLVLQPDVLALKDGQLLQSVVYLIGKNKAFMKTDSRCMVRLRYTGYGRLYHSIQYNVSVLKHKFVIPGLRSPATGLALSQSLRKSLVLDSMALSSVTIFICKLATWVWIDESLRRIISLNALHSPYHTFNTRWKKSTFVWLIFRATNPLQNPVKIPFLRHHFLSSLAVKRRFLYYSNQIK